MGMVLAYKQKAVRVRSKHNQRAFFKFALLARSQCSRMSWNDLEKKWLNRVKILCFFDPTTMSIWSWDVCRDFASNGGTDTKNICSTSKDGSRLSVDIPSNQTTNVHQFEQGDHKKPSMCEHLMHLLTSTSEILWDFSVCDAKESESLGQRVPP